MEKRRNWNMNQEKNKLREANEGNPDETQKQRL